MQLQLLLALKSMTLLESTQMHRGAVIVHSMRLAIAHLSDLHADLIRVLFELYNHSYSCHHAMIAAARKYRRYRRCFSLALMNNDHYS
jgi:hypothetical protein